LTIELYLAFVGATIVLLIIPGPNVALIIANSVSHGRRYGLMTVVGTSAAMVPQLALTVLGVTATVTTFAHLFEWIRWLGVAYLVYLGLQASRAQPLDLTSVRAEVKNPKAMFLRGFFVSITNPKTLLFYGAFFPQFVAPGEDFVVQLLLLLATFLSLAVLVDGCWAVAAARLRGVLAVRGALRNQLTGSFYLAAAFGLAMARKPS
jgi:threonine/homoserine/homoserine lactone efflux protein